MRRLTMLVAILLGIGTAMSAASAGNDPFDDARYYVVNKQNDQALALLDGGAFEIGQANDEGWTLLHFAAEANNLDMVKALIKRGADPNAKTKSGSTPYTVSSATMVKAAIAKAIAAPGGGSTVLPTPSATAVPVAATNGSNGMCAAVRGERVSDSRSPALRPWLRARDDVWYNHPDELALLLDDCVDANFQSDGARWTLLHEAAQRDRVEAAKVLLAHRADRSLRTREGERPADLAKSPEMQALLGPKAAANPVNDATTPRAKECLAKREADAALCSDTTCRMHTLTKQQQCLKTGLYY